MKRIAPHLLLVLLALAAESCTGLKSIVPEDPLYIGSEVEFEGRPAEGRTLAPVAREVIQVKPNTRFLWMRPALARYNMLSDSARMRKFWKRKVAAPVRVSQVDTRQTALAMQDRIFHKGYFDNTVAVDTLRKGKRKARMIYMVWLAEPYRLGSIDFPTADTDLDRQIDKTKAESALRPGDIYTLDAVKRERERIDGDLKEVGYIYFSPDFIALRADSVTGDHRIRGEIVLKPETPPESRRPFTIRKIFIHDDPGSDGQGADTTYSGDYALISRNQQLNLQTLRRGIFLQPGNTYARSDHGHSIRYLNELPIIRNASVKFGRVGESDSLDATFYLSQKKRFAYTAEFNTVFRSTNYFGPGIIFSYTDRNARHGSEMLKINLRGSFEMQIVEEMINPAYELGLGVTYTLPRFYPDIFFESVRKSLPKTSISAAYNLFNRLDLYRLNAVTVNYGYRWSKTDRMSHALNPLEINYTRLPEDSKSDAFKEYLAENPGVQRSFDEQFILGPGYEFTYQPERPGRNSFFFRGGLDIAGHVLSLLYSVADAPRDSLGRYRLLGVPFSQYIRTRFDLRNYFQVKSGSRLVTRLSAGVGIPVGNSDILPYIKQFYVGGTNSLRSFIARSVGPGSETPPEGYNDVTGDIRLEANVEYRFTLAGNLKGALFVDAGNIWLFNEDPSRPNGHFRLDTFLDQIAVSAGWGLRWDWDFIVARFDFGYTIRTPYLPEGERWTAGLDFWDPAFNLAIGYPF